MITVQRDHASADAWACPAPNSVLWGAASVYGSYFVLHFDLSTVIFPHSKKAGKKIRVVCPRHAIHLMHESGQQITLRVYKHQKTWFYADSRDEQSASKKPEKGRASMVSEIARLLFGRDEARADAFLSDLTSA